MRELPRGITLLLLSSALGLPEAASPSPISTLPGLQSISFVEISGGPATYTYTPTGPQLTVRLPGLLSSTNKDFGGVSTEYYDVYYSNADGSFNLNGEYVSIESVFGGISGGGGLNLAEVILDFGSGQEYANHVASFVALGSNAIPSSVGNAIDANTATYTTMGNTVGQDTRRLRLTLGFLSSSGAPCSACELDILMQLAAIEAKLDKLLDGLSPTEELCCGKPFSAFGSVDDRRSATTPQTITGTSRKDCLIGGSAGDVIAGKGDDDCIIGNDGNDTLHGDQGTFVLSSGKDTIFGGPGHDTIYGDANDDEIHGGEDGDDIVGDAGADRIFGDGGDDTINGDAGQDFIDGGDGNDVIVGDAQSDTVCGGPGTDSIRGKAQGDRIDGGAGNDNCDGDQGADDCWRCETTISCSPKNGSSAACPP